MATLEEVKTFATEFLEKGSRMSEMICSLNLEQIKEFNEWYKNVPHYKILVGLSGLVGLQSGTGP
jgi:hypothetical protein